MDTGEGVGAASGAPAGQSEARTAPGLGPYARLAVGGYLCQTVFVLYSVVLVATSDLFFQTQLPWNLASTAISLFLSFVWVQLGRRQRVSWFTAAGVAGGLGALLALVGSLDTALIVTSQSSITSPSGTFVWSVAANEAGSIVSLVYLAAQLMAYYTASKVFQVRLFRYAAYLLAVGVVGPPVSVVIMAGLGVSAPEHPEVATTLVYGVGLLFSAATSLTALAGFLQFERPRA